MICSSSIGQLNSKRFANRAARFQAQIEKYWIGLWSAVEQPHRWTDGEVPR
jgi:hypothetical protein